VVLLQHPRERDKPIGTARMASLCLPQAELHVGIRWDDSPVLKRALANREAPPVLLYPGEGARDVLTDPPRGPVTLFVIDGTWSQAKSIVRDNAQLRALPRYAFTPPRESEYRIRREPKAAYVSTIEALVHVLGALEGDAARFEALLAPFRAMVDMQLSHIGSGLRRPGVPRPRPPRSIADRVAPVLREKAVHLVCVVADANAWPYAERGDHPDELVHWVAVRLGAHGGEERFERIVRPTGELGPNTELHTRLTAAQLAEGVDRAALFRDFAAFLREDDVLCAWGHYAPALYRAGGGTLPAVFDIREAGRRFARGKVGTLEQFCEQLTVAAEPAGLGRAGSRLGLLSALTRRLAAAGSDRA
jgi:DTW domain-containing protein YfiP